MISTVRFRYVMFSVQGMLGDTRELQNLAKIQKIQRFKITKLNYFSQKLLRNIFQREFQPEIVFKN